MKFQIEILKQIDVMLQNPCHPQMDRTAESNKYIPSNFIGWGKSKAS